MSRAFLNFSIDSTVKNKDITQPQKTSRQVKTVSKKYIYRTSERERERERSPFILSLVSTIVYALFQCFYSAFHGLWPTNLRIKDLASAASF